jgi:hypothetical protein
MPVVKTAGEERQIRLKHEHADHYKGILPGEWIPAWVMAERLLALAEAAEIPPHERICDPHHFEFRGGTGREPELRNLRTRRTDTPSPPTKE